MTRAVLTASLFALLLAACSRQPGPVVGPEPATPIKLPGLMSTGVADEATDVVVTPNGEVLVVGLNGTGGEPSNRLFVRRYGSEGDLRWTREVGHCRNPPSVAGEIEDGTLLSCYDLNVKVATDGAGNAYVLSQTYET